jgi:hypothetical protein
VDGRVGRRVATARRLCVAAVVGYGLWQLVHLVTARPPAPVALPVVVDITFAVLASAAWVVGSAPWLKVVLRLLRQACV